MPRHAIVAILPLLVGCHRPPTAQGPYLSGTITSRAARLYTIQILQGSRTDSVPQMKVEAEPGAPPSPLCDYVAYFSLAAVHSVRYASGHTADTSALTVGTKVRVWATGIVLTSCPPQVAADEIIIESPVTLAAPLRPNPRQQPAGAWPH